MHGDRSGRDARAGGLRAQGGVEDPMGQSSFVGSDTAEAITKYTFTLGEISSPHLQDRIGEAGLEDAAGHRGPHRLTAGVKALPGLLGSDARHADAREHLDLLG